MWKNCTCRVVDQMLLLKINYQSGLILRLRPVWANIETPTGTTLRLFLRLCVEASLPEYNQSSINSSQSYCTIEQCYTYLVRRTRYLVRTYNGEKRRKTKSYVRGTSTPTGFPD